MSSKLLKHVTSAGIALAVVVGSVIPTEAAMVRTPAPATITQGADNLVEVRHDGHRYWRGHRGYHHRRPGYRRHNGYWFPLAAFGAGAIIGGAIASQPAPRASGVNPRHYQWCANRYRSYDARSNTFQPYHGPRQACYSPYY